MKGNCNECLYFYKSNNWCRRYPPAKDGCPNVGEHWVCGEFKLIENENETK